MNIHEYQGKELLRANGVPVLDGVHCKTVNEALDAYDKLNSKVVAVKSQIHAGGRGKGNLYHPDSGDLVMEGGVKIAFSRDEVETYAQNILGNILVTIQTGESGKLVRNLYVESGCDIALHQLRLSSQLKIPEMGLLASRPSVHDIPAHLYCQIRRIQVSS